MASVVVVDVVASVVVGGVVASEVVGVGSVVSGLVSGLVKKSEVVKGDSVKVSTVVV